MTPRTLVAGFGNVLRGDDGFGLEVLRQLADAPLADNVELLDVGTGGIRLAQELLGGYTRLIIIDAMTENGRPGTLYVRAIEGVMPAREIDMHSALPSRALMLARALGSLPPQIYMVGCEPDEVDELLGDLSPVVRAAVPAAVAAVRKLLDESPTAAAGASIKIMDEVLELLFWMEGEGFAGGSTSLDGMIRFLAQPAQEVERALQQLTGRGDVVSIAGGEYRLTEVGRKEAARRFAEEFAPMLAQGHGECSDPDCDCQTSPEGPAACRSHNHGSH